MLVQKLPKKSKEKPLVFISYINIMRIEEPHGMVKVRHALLRQKTQLFLTYLYYL